MLVYVDTNVYLDYFENRTDRLRPLGEFAFQFFRRTEKCEFEIVVSDFVLEELSKRIDEKQQEEFFKPLYRKEKIHEIKSTHKDKQKAMAVGIHWQDSLHAILAKKAGAECVVTRNLDDFAGLVEAHTPEEI